MSKTAKLTLACLARALGSGVVYVLVAGLVLLVVAALFARTDDRGVTRVAGHPVMTVLSDSMTPTFRAGDLLVESSVAINADRLAVGDVITFQTGNGDDLVTHRIIKVAGEPTDGTVRYGTQGDANNAPDQTSVAPEDIVGLYSWRIPYGGYVLEAARSQLVLSLLVFIAGAALLMPMLAKWWRSAGQNDAETMAAHTETDEAPGGAPGEAREGVGV